MKVRLMIEGGAMKLNPAISQKVGPLGLNMGKVMQDVNKKTQEFKGMKLPVVLDINTKTKEVNVEVLSPPASEMVKKELGLEKGSGEPHKTKVANVAIEQLIKVAKSKQALEKDLKSALKSVVGVCRSLGILIESKDPEKVTQEIDEGVYDKQIKSEATEPSKEKLKELKAFFDDLAKSQEAQKKKEEEEKAKAEEEKAAAAAPAAGASPEAGKAKPEEKKAEKK